MVTELQHRKKTLPLMEMLVIFLSLAFLAAIIISNLNTTVEVSAEQASQQLEKVILELEEEEQTEPLASNR
jgi:competence protein ComGC